MKTKYLLSIAALVVTVLFSCAAFARPPVKYYKPEVHVDVPADVLKLTALDSGMVPNELNQPASVTYGSMKSEIQAKVQFAYGLQLINESGSQILVVANGKPAYFVRDGKKAGMFVMDSASQSPIPLRWFEEYGDGDVLIIGMFLLERDNRITRGGLFAVRFADLIDRAGNLRQIRMGIQVSQPLASLRPVHVKPSYVGEYADSLWPKVALKPGAGRLVINTQPVPPPVTGPAVVMDPFFVDEMKDWASFRTVRDSNGKITSVEVKSVREGTPYADAGLKAGMLLTSIRILAREAEQPVEDSGWTKGDIVLGVTDGAAHARTIIVPAERLRKAVHLPSGQKVASAP